jgi:crossover junction endodeoxyribonuclease RusA
MRYTETEFAELQNKRAGKSPAAAVSLPTGNAKTMVLPFPPTANHMWKVTRQGHVYLTDEGKQFKIKVAEVLAKQKVKKIDGEVAVTIKVFRPRRQGDLDNRIKPTLDALKNIAFEDDKHVVELHAYRYEDKSCPRVEVTVTAAELADKLF